MPVAIAPMAVHGLAHPDAEAATAGAAAAAGVPFTLSTMSTCSIEEVAAAAPDATRWFQLYVQADPGRANRLVERAAAAGYGAIVLTVDLPRLGYRERDRRSRLRPADPRQLPGRRVTDPSATWPRRLRASRTSRPDATLTWADLGRRSGPGRTCRSCSRAS